MKWYKLCVRKINLHDKLFELTNNDLYKNLNNLDENNLLKIKQVLTEKGVIFEGIGKNFLINYPENSEDPTGDLTKSIDKILLDNINVIVSPDQMKLLQSIKNFFDPKSPATDFSTQLTGNL